ncbi:hypothetical protein [Saccharospirillum impatiens]|uniref:hypothetical protein n=1 Tax=Saccharospirillum impatiens TaxID=169438 RepID=UPI00048F94F5|nr:hypothetical protein [Saccharospirillum impatiens]
MSDLQVGKTTRVGNIALIPLFRVNTVCIEQPDFFWLNGTAEPFAVVIVEPGRVRAIQVDAGELSVEWLIEQIAGLDSAIQDGAKQGSDSIK